MSTLLNKLPALLRHRYTLHYRLELGLLLAPFLVGTALLIAALAPVAIVIAYETVGHRHQEQFLERAWATSQNSRH